MCVDIPCHTPLIIRADASREIGSGHIMRCLALAEVWKESYGDVCFVLGIRFSPIEERIRQEGFGILPIAAEPGSLEDAEETSGIARTYGSDWIVLDGYHFNAAYQKALHEKGHKILCIDDYGHAGHYYADIVLNQNIYADLSIYPSHESYTRFLLGPRYVLLRKEFRNCPVNRGPVTETARKVLVTFGGSDPENITGFVINALKQVPLEGLEVKIISGGLNQNLSRIQEAVSGCPRFSVISNIRDMTEILSWADIAIAGGGTTCWELIYMGVPSLLYPIAENQKKNVEFLTGRNIVRFLDLGDPSRIPEIVEEICHFLCSPAQRSLLSANMNAIIPGSGVQCVILQMIKADLNLRPVEPTDCSLLWEWANDPDVRNSSFHEEQIPFSEHSEWFSRKLDNPDSTIFILEYGRNNPIGQIRFDTYPGRTEVDVSIRRELRGCGVGSYLIRRGIEKFLEEKDRTKIDAYVKIQNASSLYSFERAGFMRAGEETLFGCKVVHLVWEPL